MVLRERVEYEPDISRPEVWGLILSKNGELYSRVGCFNIEKDHWELGQKLFD